jgi:hypothetical protein
MNRPGFQAIDGTKNLAAAGIAPDLLFTIGEGTTVQTSQAGTLYLGINAWHVVDNSGGFVVEISQAYDAAAQFSSTQNPNGVWSYGCSQSLGATFHPYTQQTPLSNGLYDWGTAPVCGQTNPPSVAYNSTDATFTSGSVTVPAHTIWFHPGPQDQNSVLRWTAPASGNYQVKAVFWGDDFEGPTTTDVHVLHNRLCIYSGEVSGYGPSSDQSFTSTISVAAGDTIDFAVGYGTDRGYGFDSTGVSAVITPE